jgi:hypothetical protein
VAAHLAGFQPPIDGPYVDSAQQRDLAFCQKLSVVGVFERHHRSSSRVLSHKDASRQCRWKAPSLGSANMSHVFLAGSPRDAVDGELHDRPFIH